MTYDDAKFLLRVGRPNGADAADPAIAEAIERARKDPILLAWWERERAHDQAVAAKIQGLVPPAGLREAILAGARMSGPLPWWRRIGAWPMAAAAALALMAAVWSWHEVSVRRDIDRFTGFAYAAVHRGVQLETFHADLSELRAYLARADAPMPEKLPPSIRKLGCLGARKLDYVGHEVSVICFRDTQADSGRFHLFIVRRGDFPELEPPSKPRIEQDEDIASAVWGDHAKVYVLVAEQGLPALRTLF